jgi:uncharacterized protein with ParB-like and HNH nuclease domain
MSVINTYPLLHNSVLSVFADRDRINMAPEYQRQGEIWSLDKRQLLIDSMINRYDIPKLYFHKLDAKSARKYNTDYAVVDGRQRLEAIFSFIDGDYPLSNDFEYLEDPSVNAAGMTYNDLARKHPRLKQRLDAFTLPIMCVETEDLELIEDMFSRLNEAVPLNAAEKRNAIGGDMAKAFREIAEHPFFTKKIRFSNKRYQHREVAARLSFLEHCMQDDRLVDTKKPFLDQFTRQFQSGKKNSVAKIKTSVTDILKILTPLFSGKDILLAAQSAVPIYYLVARKAKNEKKSGKLTRSRLVDFHDRRQDNRQRSESDITQGNFELLEYDRLSQQGTNDASSIRERVRILSKFLGI